MLQKTHVNGFRAPKYAGEQCEYVTCQKCAGEMWQELERDLGLLLEVPDYIEKALNSGHFIFYAEEQYKYYPNRIYQYTFRLSDHEKILISLDANGNYEKAMYVFGQYGRWDDYEENYELDYYEIIENLFEIGKVWLANQPFTSFVEFRKHTRDLEIMKNQETEMWNSPR